MDTPVYPSEISTSLTQRLLILIEIPQTNSILRHR